MKLITFSFRVTQTTQKTRIDKQFSSKCISYLYIRHRHIFNIGNPCLMISKISNMFIQDSLSSGYIEMNLTTYL